MFGEDDDAGSSSSSYEGAFYVETDANKRYWANPAGAANFVKSIETSETTPVISPIASILASSHPKTLPVGDVPKTATLGNPSVGSYLNPFWLPLSASSW